MVLAAVHIFGGDRLPGSRLCFEQDLRAALQVKTLLDRQVAAFGRLLPEQHLRDPTWMINRQNNPHQHRASRITRPSAIKLRFDACFVSSGEATLAIYELAKRQAGHNRMIIQPRP